jgi:hypothetical protein
MLSNFKETIVDENLEKTTMKDWMNKFHKNMFFCQSNTYECTFS